MIPLLDLKKQYSHIQAEAEEAVCRILRSGSYILGEPVAEFEQAFADYVGTKHCIAVNTGTSALHLALLALDIGPGDEVITVPMTFVATVAAIEYAGAKPVLVDIDPRTYTLDVDQLENAITPRTRAIMPVHLYGQPADMSSILAIAREYELHVIEDAAQAHGAKYQNKPVGSFGDIAGFSFYPGKNLGACGEGGAVVTNDSQLAETVRQLRDWGQKTKGICLRRGFNYRMDTIQGALLVIKLKYLDDWTAGRRRVASEYDRIFKNSPLTTPSIETESFHVYHQYALICPDREQIQENLQRNNIASGIHYPVPVHLHPAYSDLGYSQGDFPVAEYHANHELSLPIFPELLQSEIQHIAETVLESCERAPALAINGKGTR